MTTGDIVVLPQVPCDVAGRALHVWHDYIKNGFMFLTGERLANWIRDQAAMRAFEECARSVCDEIAGFSAATMIPQLVPLADLPVGRRHRLVNALNRAFEEDFGPARVAARIAEKLDPLVCLVREFQVASPKKRHDERKSLEMIRQAAAELRTEFEALPSGFWLPAKVTEDGHV